jgi:hypothetical protein
VSALRPTIHPTVGGLEQVLPEPALRVLAPTISALDRLLDEGSLLSDPGGEPCGFDGIDRRGSVEHLLPSEWLLLGEEPDEFLRRLVTAELSYLHVARSAEQRTRSLLVLFDTGPEQLGAPRLVHLACLVVLARRAGVPIRFGTFQAEQRREVVDEALVVSGRLWPQASMNLLLRDGEDGIVEAEFHDGRRHRLRRALLPLPTPDDAIRLLRDPFGSGGTAEVTAGEAAASNLVFDQTGNRLFARKAGGRVVVSFPVPNSPNAPAGKVRLYRSGSTRPSRRRGESARLSSS